MANLVAQNQGLDVGELDTVQISNNLANAASELGLTPAAWKGCLMGSGEGQAQDLVGVNDFSACLYTAVRLFQPQVSPRGADFFIGFLTPLG